MESTDERVAALPDELPDWQFTADIFFNDLVGGDDGTTKDIVNFMAGKIAMKLITIYINTPGSLEDPLSSSSPSGCVHWINLLQGFTSCILPSDLSIQTLKMLKLLGLLENLRKCSVTEYDGKAFRNLVQLLACVKKFPELKEDTGKQRSIRELQDEAQRQDTKKYLHHVHSNTTTDGILEGILEAHPFSEFHERVKTFVSSMIIEKDEESTSQFPNENSFKEQEEQEEQKEQSTTSKDVVPNKKTEPSLSVDHSLATTEVKVEEKAVVLSSQEVGTSGLVKLEEITFGDLEKRDTSRTGFSKMFDMHDHENSPIDILQWSSDESMDVQPSHLNVTEVVPTNRQKRASSTVSQETTTAPKRRRLEWSTEEIEFLKKGVDKLGVGKWKEIRKLYPFNGRSNVDLKDKWRNLKGARNKQID